MRLLLLGRELKGKSILLLILLLHCRQVPFAASLKPCDAMWFFQQKKKKNLSITADYAFSSIWERAFNETWEGLICHWFNTYSQYFFLSIACNFIKHKFLQKDSQADRLAKNASRTVEGKNGLLPCRPNIDHEKILEWALAMRRPSNSIYLLCYYYHYYSRQVYQKWWFKIMTSTHIYSERKEPKDNSKREKML